MEQPKLIKKGTILQQMTKEGKSFQLRLKTDNMHVTVTELEPEAPLGNQIKHKGEEIHMVVHGKLEFVVGEHSYILEEGDWLWHPSNLPHHTRNLGKEKAKFITIGHPPTFW